VAGVELLLGEGRSEGESGEESESGSGFRRHSS
jgi:hypothetical protein